MEFQEITERKNFKREQLNQKVIKHLKIVIS